MGIKILKNFYKKKYLFLIFFLLSFAQLDLFNLRNNSFAFTSQDNKSSNKKIDNFGNEYLLDSGDSLFINFIGTEIFNGIYTVNPEGNIILPEINRLQVRGYTIQQLEEILNKIYEEFIFNPEINASIQAYRPINIYIRGAVKTPGLYVFNVGSLKTGNIYQNTDSNLLKPINIKDNQNNDSRSSLKIPKLFDAIKIARGFTHDADLSNIKIIRNNSNSANGKKIFTEINLLSLFLEGDQSQNIRLFDGDSIFINKGGNINKTIIELNRSNISPDFITVYLSGNIEKKGLLNIRQGSSLLQALASAGGTKDLTGKLSFLRFEPEGMISKRRFNIDNNAPINSYKNPILFDGDIINIEKSLIGKTTSILKEFSSPIISGYSLYNLFDD